MAYITLGSFCRQTYPNFVLKLQYWARQPKIDNSIKYLTEQQTIGWIMHRIYTYIYPSSSWKYIDIVEPINQSCLHTQTSNYIAVISIPISWLIVSLTYFIYIYILREDELINWSPVYNAHVYIYLLVFIE